MNAAQIQGIIRSIVLTAGGIAGAVGWLSSVDWASIAGALATLGGLAWSIYSNSDKSLVTQAAKSDDVHEITTNPTIANQVDNPKVVPLS